MDIQIQTRKNVFWLSFKRLGEGWKKSYRQNDFPAKTNSLKISLFFPSLFLNFKLIGFTRIGLKLNKRVKVGLEFILNCPKLSQQVIL